ncbi:MAG: winged helix-turn-helix transcriptional regulator [Alphaproteobacteria bacterium]
MKNNLSPCPVEVTLQMLENKWRVLIIRDLIIGTKRFGELMKSLEGISQRSLTLNLRAMEANALVRRKVYAEVPPRVEYSLTDVGLTLVPILNAMKNWGDEYKKKVQ